MKCCSRSTLGVIIGFLNILIYIMVSIVVIALAGNSNDLKSQYNEIYEEHKKELKELSTFLLCTILSVCLVMAVVSGVLIMGIVKRRHKLMIPWLVLSGIGFACDCLRVFIVVLIGFMNDLAFSTIISTFFLNLLGCGIEALILWPIYTLWRDLRLKHEENSERIMGGGGVRYERDPPPEYNYYGFLPQKS
ncbi:uncharacterized protein ACRADG_011342 [Cochliomyia hominivorax]